MSIPPIKGPINCKNCLNREELDDGAICTNPVQQLKELAQSIAPILRLIFQTSYDTGTVPQEWREANVVPIYKKGRKSDPSNYRPISLTCIACKLMEHIIA